MLILVVLCASWCPKCHMMLPIVDELEMEFLGEWKIRRIDIEKQPDEATNYDIEIVPTFILQKDGNEIGRMAGMIGEETLKRRLRDLVERRKKE